MSSSKINPPAYQGVRLLSLDGGGIRGLSELLIIEEIMERIKVKKGLEKAPPPAEYFDLIGGTSTGGLVALLLGRLKLSAAEAIVEYEKLAGEVFSEKKFKGHDGTFKASKLEQAIKGAVERSKKSAGAKMFEPGDSEGSCKAFVCAVGSSNVVAAAGPTLFRTYQVSRNNTYNCTVWEAGRATSAAPTFFKRIKIGPPNSAVEYFDAGLGYNNPTEQVIDEAKLAFGESSRVSCIVSIGTGETGEAKYARPDKFQKWLPTALIDVLKKIATDSGVTAEKLEKKYAKTSGLYYRLNVNVGLRDVSLEEWKKLGEVREHTQNYMRLQSVWPKIDELVETLVGNKFISTDPYDINQLSGSLPAKDSKMLYLYPPHQASYFVERAVITTIGDNFMQLSETSTEPVVVILLGMGGCGKTQLALEYCRLKEAERNYKAIFWIDAANPNTLVQSFTQIAKAIYGSEQDFADGNALVDSVIRTMKGWSTAWLMVFDNYDHPDAFNNTGKAMKEYWPNCGKGSVLFTSRHGKAVLLGRKVPISGMTLDDGVDLLFRRTEMEREGENEKCAEEIVRILAFLPLAIDQAGAFIRVNELKLQEYPDYFKNRREIVLREIPDSSLWGYRKRITKVEAEAEAETALSVFTTWQMSYDSISNDHEKEMKGHMLTLSAFLDCKSVSEQLFRTNYESNDSKPDWMVIFGPQGTWDRYLYRQVLMELKNLSLIYSFDYRTDGAEFSLHPLIKDWAQLRLSPSLRQQYTKEAAEMIVRSLPLTDVEELWSLPLEITQKLVAHIDASIQNHKYFMHQADWPGIGSSSETGYRFATFFLRLARYDDAKEILERALLSTEGRVEPVFGYSRTVLIIVKLASISREQRQYKDCKSMSLRAVEMSNKHLDDESYGTWVATLSMAAVYRHEHNYEDAELLYLQCFEKGRLTDSSQYKPCRVARDLSPMYAEMHHLKEAEYYAEFAHKGFVLLQGPDTFTALDAEIVLVDIWIRRGLFGKAESALPKIKARFERLLGATHPKTLKSEELLGTVYRHQERWLDAIEVFTSVKKKLEEVFGLKHPQCLSLNLDIARSLMSQEEVRKAETLLLETLADYKAMGGEDAWHHIQGVAVWLIQLYSKLQEYQKAETLSNDILAENKAAGNSFVLRMDLLWQAYFLYGNQNKTVEMEDFLDQALKESSKVLGPKNHVMCRYLQYAQTGYEILNSPEKLDRYSGELLCCWYETGGSQYHRLRVDNDLSTDASKYPLPPPLLTICNALLEWRFAVDRRFLAISVATLHIGDEANTQIACERTIDRSIHEKGLPHEFWTCDMCSSQGIRGTFFQCKICIDCSLCSDCFGKYGDLERPLKIEWPSPSECIGHGFLQIPRPGWMQFGQEVVDEQGQTLQDWITKMRDKLGHLEFPKEIQDMFFILDHLTAI